MKLSIIIVNYNSGAVTKSLLESLLSQKLPAKTEIIVVDNNSTDESVSFLRSDFPEVTVIDNKENVGLAAGVNVGLAAAKGVYCLILNPDIIALPDAIARLVHFMDNHSDVGMAGGKLISPNGKLQHSCYRFYSLMTIIYRRTPLGRSSKGKKENARFLMKDFNHQSIKDVDWLMGACLMVRNAAVKDVGGMDERYFLYFEDVDWCRRMWLAGWRVVYMPQAVFSHFYQQSSRQDQLLGIITSPLTREHIKSASKYFMKFRGQPVPTHK